MAVRRKSYDELTFTDDFMFCKVLVSNLELCRQLLELILGIKIREVRLSEAQKSIALTYDGHGVRFDVYVEDDENTVFDIEMQVLADKCLPKRMRYYQGMIDLNLISSGAKYKDLRKSYIIFICMYDPLGGNLPIYHIRSICLEDSSIPFDDEAEKVIVNVEGSRDNLSPELAAFFEYLKKQSIGSEFTRALENEVEKARQHIEWRADYMSLQEKFDIEREEGREEGMKMGLEKGLEKGLKQGRLNLIEQMLQAGIITPEQARQFA